MAFQFCDVAIESNVGLHELPVCDQSFAQLRFEMRRGQAPAGAGEMLHEWELPEGSSWLSILRHDGGYLLRFPELATFFVAGDLDCVSCWPTPDTPADTVRHLFLDQVMPLVLGRMGRAVLHASVVTTGGVAIAFAGPSGRGKSTLAASFLQAGAKLLSDDCLVLDETAGGFVNVPSYPGVRLWPDMTAALASESLELRRVCHYSPKNRVGIPFSPERLPLRRIYLLAEDGPEVSITPVPALETLIELTQVSYVLDTTDRVAHQRQFETLSRLAALGLCYRLSYPRKLDRLADVQAAVLENAS